MPGEFFAFWHTINERLVLITSKILQIYIMATGWELFEYTAGVFLKDIARAIGGPRPAFWPKTKWVKGRNAPLPFPSHFLPLLSSGDRHQMLLFTDRRPNTICCSDEAYRGDDHLPQNGSAFAEFVHLLLAPDPDYRPTTC